MSSTQRYKETKIGEIPEDWEIVSFAKVADFVNGYGFKTSDWRKEGLPIVRIQNLKDPNAEFNYFDGTIDDKYHLKNGDLLLSWSASLGVYIWNRGKAVLNQHIFKVIPKSGINKDYLHYASYKAIEDLKRRIHGSTMRHFKKRELDATSIPLPPLPEQHKIASVLSTVDEAIQKTDEAIGKAEMLKLGLMQRLLSRGIGHTKFKQTELGEIPEAWTIVRVGDVCEIIIPGRNKPKKFDGNIPWITLPDLEGMYVSSSKSGLAVSVSEIKKCGNKIIPRNSVIMSCVGKFGIVAINTRDLVINQQLHAFKCPKYIDPYFLAVALMSQKKYMLKIATKTIVPYLNKEKCNSIPIPLPDFEEQKKISTILSYIDQKIEDEKRSFSKLQKLKEGLMQVLLTGKIRVKVD